MRSTIKALSAALLYLAVNTAFASEVTPLHQGWQLQSACKLQDDGAAISSTSYKPANWIATVVPSTVLAAQSAANLTKDVDYGMNLRGVPGTTYPIGANFANQPMPADSPYKCGWWYRKTFSVPASDRNKTLWLRFAGINYRADIWINGKLVADKNTIQGAFTAHELNATPYLIAGKENTLAVETFAPTENDLAMAWADWNPMPPDKEMGLWGTVDFVATGPVEVTFPAVTTHFSDTSLKQADLTVYAELRNATDKPISGTVTASLEGLHLQQKVDLTAGESKSIAFAPEQYEKLKIRNPRLWWPAQMGKPNLENLTMTFTADGRVSDSVSIRYGIREITSELIARSTKGDDIIAAAPEPLPPPEKPRAPRPANAPNPENRPRPTTPRPRAPEPPPQQAFSLYRINGKPILIRGGGWAPDMLLRNDPAKLRAQFRMVHDMGLNTIRSEGKMETEDFFHLADEQGVLVMIGWTCCDRWERWRNWTPENYQVSLESLHSQIIRLRAHPSVLMWLNGSDNPPPANVETSYLKEEKELHWPNPTLSSATRRATSVTGESGVKMEGPYDYVAPAYWEIDKKYGGAWGFATEIGPGPAIPTIDQMKKFLPEASIWPHDDVWRYHAGGGGFKDVTVFNKAMDNIYGGATTAVEYNKLSQAMAYDGERAMFEAYSRNKYNSTGVIQWMLNNAWPSVIWHLYDFYLDTGGGYFGTKKACEPLHIQYSYDDHSIWVVNSEYAATDDLTATAAVYDDAQKKVFSDTAEVKSTPDSSLKAISIPDSVFASGSSLYFVQLTLKNKAGAVVSRNFYWLPAKASTYDWAKTRYTTTPIETYEDMTALRKLPEAKVVASVQVVGGKAELHLHNASQALAFQVAVNMDAADEVKNSPVLWSDNYVELMPGESLTLSAALPAGMKGVPEFHLSGWNIEDRTLRPVGAMASAK